MSSDKDFEPSKMPDAASSRDEQIQDHVRKVLRRLIDLKINKKLG